MIGTEFAVAGFQVLHVAALCSLFGTLLSSAFVIRVPDGAAGAARLRRCLDQLTRFSALAALGSGLLWFGATAATLTGASTPAEALASVPVVALHSHYGHVLLARLGLLLGTLALLSSRRTAPLLLAGLTLALQPATSHASAVEGWPGTGLVAAEALHVLAAGAWLGGLVPLLLCILITPRECAAIALRRFFPLGCTAALLLAGTSVLQALSLIGSVPALVGTTYGQMALLKLLLFAVLLGFAALNRLTFSARPGSLLRRSIACEAGVAVVLLAAAGSLAHLKPGIHEQAEWPFPWRLDANAARVVPAYPTSFYVSPEAATADSVVRGARVYQAGCASCHGANGRGHGPAAATLAVAASDLTSRRILEYTDGDLFWFAGHQIASAESERWDLVAFLRARSAGHFARGSGRRLYPARIPAFHAVCADGRAIGPDDLLGRAMAIRVGRPDTSEPAITVTMYESHVTPPDPTTHCTAQPEALEALSTLLGSNPGELDGSQFLVDANGWLRARWRPGEPGGWADASVLSSRLQILADHPLPLGSAQRHSHRN